MNNIEQYEQYTIKDMKDLTEAYKKLIQEECNSTQNKEKCSQNALNELKEVFYK